MSLETAVQALTDATTDLIETVQVQKTALDNAVTSAGTFANTAAEALALAYQVYDGIDAITAALSAATTLYDTFDDRFLGAKNAAPTLDNDGNALQVGALYWDTQLTGMQVWSGSAWVDLADNVVSEESARVLSDQQLLEAVSYATDLAGQVARSLPLKQATSSLLTAIAALTPTDSTFIVGNGTTFVAESGATVRTSLGLGDSATKNVGTSSSTVAAGDHVHTGVYQPLDADLTAVAELSATGLIERTGAGTASIVTLTAAGKALLDDADASAQRTTLGAAAAADLGTETDNRVLYDEELVRAVTYATDLAGQAARTLSGSVPSAAPASKTAPGVAGQLRYASGFLYLCVAKDTWKRVAITDEGWT